MPLHSDSEVEEDICYACGIDITDAAIVAPLSGNQFCSTGCFTSGMKYVPPEKPSEDDVDNVEAQLSATVRGKCNGKIIKGKALFDPHGTVHLDFDEPQLRATFDVPKLFLQIVKELYEPSDDE